MNAALPIIMKFFTFRTASALSLAVLTSTLLAACGSGTQNDVGQAAQVQTTGTPTTAVATANMPAPDCAADNCRSLRIIDANAEAYRYDAQRRAALADGNPQS
jgi:predicted small secreted protein